MPVSNPTDANPSPAETDRTEFFALLAKIRTGHGNAADAHRFRELNQKLQGRGPAVPTPPATPAVPAPAEEAR